MVNVYISSKDLFALNEAKVDTPDIADTDADIQVEIIDQAVTTHLKASGGDISFYACMRDEAHTDTLKIGEMKGDARQGKLSAAVAGEDDSEEKKEMLVSFYGLTCAAAKIIIDHLSEDDMPDEESGGILMTVREGEPYLEVLSGGERPDLLCTVLSGGTQIARPYADELVSALFDDDDDDDEMSLEDMEKAAEEGDEHYMQLLADRYSEGDDRDPEKSLYFMEMLANEDNTVAMFNTALYYAKAFGTERDFDKALYWMRRAADEGDDDAEMLLKGFERTAEAARKAAAGDPQAQADLAQKLTELADVLDIASSEDDYDAAYEWAEKSAAAGCIDGMCVMGTILVNGWGRDYDVDRALELFRKGVEAGNASCITAMGLEYLPGENVEKDEKKAFDMFMQAAEMGYGPAVRQVGCCYQFAQGTKGNLKKALDWYEKALEILNDIELRSRLPFLQAISDMPGFDEDFE